MSFILDALRKSETERQRQGTAEFAGVPTHAVTSGAPRWLWIVAALLAVNLAVLLGLLMRPEAGPVEAIAAPVAAPTPAHDAMPEPAASTNAESPAASAGGENSFIEQVAAARRHEPLPADSPKPLETAEPKPLHTPEPLQTADTVAAPASGQNVAGLPSFVEVLTNGTVQLPDLHLDIHVYSEVPEERFVFINMSKQREKSQLSEGPVVEEITPDGVILDYLGTRFLLSRD